jgi:hypothetical protein
MNQPMKPARLTQTNNHSVARLAASAICSHEMPRAMYHTIAIAME